MVIQRKEDKCEAEYKKHASFTVNVNFNEEELRAAIDRVNEAFLSASISMEGVQRVSVTRTAQHSGHWTDAGRYVWRGSAGNWGDEW